MQATPRTDCAFYAVVYFHFCAAVLGKQYRSICFRFEFIFSRDRESVSKETHLRIRMVRFLEDLAQLRVTQRNFVDAISKLFVCRRWSDAPEGCAQVYTVLAGMLWRSLAAAAMRVAQSAEVAMACSRVTQSAANWFRIAGPGNV